MEYMGYGVYGVYGYGVYGVWGIWNIHKFFLSFGGLLSRNFRFLTCMVFMHTSFSLALVVSFREFSGF